MTSRQLHIAGIIETIVACGVMLVLCLVFNQWWYLFVVSSVAPFLLLRTSASTCLGIRMIDDCLANTGSEPQILDSDGEMGIARETVGALWLDMRAAISGLYCRIVSTVRTVWRKPAMSVRNIPENWVWAWDHSVLLQPIEIVPEAGYYPGYMRSLTHDGPAICTREAAWPLRLLFGVPIQSALGMSPAFIAVYVVSGLSPLWRDTLIAILIGKICINYGNCRRAGIDRGASLRFSLGSLYTIFVLLPIMSLRLLEMSALIVMSLAYKWSLKTTLLVWSPVIYHADHVFKTVDVTLQLKKVRRSARSAWVRRYAFVTGGFWTLKYLVIFFKTESILIVSSQYDLPVQSFIQPMKICAWQIVVIVNAMLTYALYWYCDDELINRETDRENDRVREFGQRDIKVANTIALFRFVRSVGATYTVACTMWILLHVAMNLKPFPVEWHFWP